MHTLSQNSDMIIDAVKSTIKTSFIDIKLSSKWFNHKDNYSIEVNIGSPRNPVKDSAFYKSDVEALLAKLDHDAASFSVKAHDFREVTDKRSGKKFQIMNIKFDYNL